MSYNGIGLQTTRGSGTSGYIQTNLGTTADNENVEVRSSHYKKRRLQKQVKEKEKERFTNEAKKAQVKSEIEEHNRKRNIEVKCMELRDKLEDEEEDEEIVEEKVRNLREKLLKNSDSNLNISKAIKHEQATEDEIVEEKNSTDSNSNAYGYKPRYSSSTLKNLRSSERN